MNIAILTPTFSYFSGPDRVVQQQALKLVKPGHKVTILTLEAEMPAPPGTSLLVLGMPRSLFLQRIYRLFFFLDVLKIRKATKLLQGTDQVISHMYPMTLIAKRAQKKYHLHYTYYNMGIATPSLFQSPLERLYMHLFRYFTKITVQGADSSISISSFLQKELQRETGVAGSVELCTIDPRFHSGYDPTPIKRKYNLKFPTLLYVGRISPHKGVHLLLKAFRIVKQEYPNAKLIIVGKETFNSYAQELRTLTQNDPNIIFTGFVPDQEIPILYAACDAYTTATLWEGFNLPAAEAQACGKPVVAFNIGAHPEVVKNGTLVQPGNYTSLAQGIIAILKK